MLTTLFNFQHEISCVCSIVTIARKCTAVELWIWDRQTDGLHHHLMPPPTVGRGIMINNRQ